MNSLRARLLLSLAALVLTTGIVAGSLSFRWAFDEAIELQDSILEQVGMLALGNRLDTDLPAVGDLDAEARVVIEEIGPRAGSKRDTGSPLQSLPHDLQDGLQTISHEGEAWRILVQTRPDGSRVAVGQPTAGRDEIARDSALRTVLPLAVLVPCLMLLAGIVVRVSFRPVTRLAGHLDAGQGDRLQRLPHDGMPSELLPFVASINRLLDRIGAMFEQQRRFVAHAAHELRTPITALSLQAENLEHTDLSPDALGRLAMLQTGIRRTAHLLEQLIAHARYEMTERETTSSNLGDVAKTVVAEMLPLAETRSLDLGFGCLADVMVNVHETALTVLVRNLIENAVRHSPDGGRIDVDVSRRCHEAILQITDEGRGIPESDLANIFEPFVRGSHPTGEGSGLGLSIVRSILDNHGGSIVLDSPREQPPRGLRVIVNLPTGGQRDCILPPDGRVGGALANQRPRP